MRVPAAPKTPIRDATGGTEIEMEETRKAIAALATEIVNLRARVAALEGRNPVEDAIEGQRAMLRALGMTDSEIAKSIEGIRIPGSDS
jgi:hypothetical protein